MNLCLGFLSGWGLTTHRNFDDRMEVLVSNAAAVEQIFPTQSDH